MLVVIVYFPCQSNDRNYKSELLECLGFIEQNIASCQADSVMILGDMNFEWKANDKGYCLFKSFADEFNYTCCSDLTTNNITYITFKKRLAVAQL